MRDHTPITSPRRPERAPGHRAPAWLNQARTTTIVLVAVIDVLLFVLVVNMNLAVASAAAPGERPVAARAQRVADAFVVRSAAFPLELDLQRGCSLYTLHLDARPMGDVRLDVLAPKSVQASHRRLTFTERNWMVPQAVRICPGPRPAQGVVRHHLRSAAPGGAAGMPSVPFRVG